MIQKLEGDVRSHISIQHQLRMHIDSLNDNISSLTRDQEIQNRKYQEQIDKIKKDKRRMDELMTLKEAQNDKLMQEMTAKLREIEL